MNSALILIDFQMGFDHPIWGARNNPGAEDRARFLLDRWRAEGGAIFHIRHLSTTPGSPLNPDGGAVDHKPEVAPRPGETIIDKRVNSAFIGTDLEARLRAHGLDAVTICGLTTPHCVSTTARMAANLGFTVELAHDACAAFAGNANADWRGGGPVDPETIHTAALDHLHGEFVHILPAEACFP